MNGANRQDVNGFMLWWLIIWKSARAKFAEKQSVCKHIMMIIQNLLSYVGSVQDTTCKFINPKR